MDASTVASVGSLQYLLLAVDRIEQGSVVPDSASYALLLRECGQRRALAEGARLHATIASVRNLEQSTYVCNHLVEMYAKCGEMAMARTVFDAMQERNVYSWTIMIGAYADALDRSSAFLVYEQMRAQGAVEPNNITFVSLIGACNTADALEQGRLAHAGALEAGLESDLLVGSALVNMYGKCGSCNEADRVFHRLHVKNLITWNALIEAHAQHEQALSHDAFSWHEQKETDFFNSSASNEPKEMELSHNPSAWHEQTEIPPDSFRLFWKLESEGIFTPDVVTFMAVLRACSSWRHGLLLHASIVERGFEADAIIEAMIINMYGKTECIQDAERAFHRFDLCNLVSWNTMIAVYTKHGLASQAINLFFTLCEEGLELDNVSFVNALSACTRLAACTLGRAIHDRIMLYGLIPDGVLGTAIISMYGKCGALRDAQYVFDAMQSPDLVAWNAMLTSYMQYGHIDEALHLFSRMRKAGMKPSAVTFIGILSACSRAGLVDEGLRCFSLMLDEYGLMPSTEHFGCMMDLFGRAGLLEEAEGFLTKMPPVYANEVVWETLLGACQVHGDTKRGKRAAEHVVDLNPRNSAAFVALSNMYAAEGKWDEVDRIREAMRCNGIGEKARICTT